MNKTTFFITSMIMAYALMWAGNAVAQNDGAAERTNTPTQAPPTGDAYNQTARAEESSMDTGMIVNVAAGAYLTAECSSGSEWACPMAYSALSQAAMDALKGDESGNVGNYTDYNYDPNGSADPNYDPNGPSTYNRAMEELNETNQLSKLPMNGSKSSSVKAQIGGDLEELEKQGYGIDPKNGVLKTPGGDVPLSSVGSPASMAAGGASPAEIAATQAKLADISAKVAGRRIKKSASGFDSMGGGSGSSAGNYKYKSTNIDDYLKKMRGPSSIGKPQVGGLRKITSDGTPVGVASGSAFHMITEAYDKKRKNDEFNEEMNRFKNK